MEYIKINDYLFKSVDESGNETTYDIRNLMAEKSNFQFNPNVEREAEVDTLISSYDSIVSE